MLLLNDCFLLLYFVMILLPNELENQQNGGGAKHHHLTGEGSNMHQDEHACSQGVCSLEQTLSAFPVPRIPCSTLWCLLNDFCAHSPEHISAQLYCFALFQRLDAHSIVPFQPERNPGLNVVM